MSLRILTEEDFAKIEERRLKAAFTGPVRKGKRQADPERMDDNGELVNQVIMVICLRTRILFNVFLLNSLSSFDLSDLKVWPLFWQLLKIIYV